MSGWTWQVFCDMPAPETESVVDSPPTIPSSLLRTPVNIQNDGPIRRYPSTHSGGESQHGTVHRKWIFEMIPIQIRPHQKVTATEGHEAGLAPLSTSAAPGLCIKERFDPSHPIA